MVVPIQLCSTILYNVMVLSIGASAIMASHAHRTSRELIACAAACPAVAVVCTCLPEHLTEASSIGLV